MVCHELSKPNTFSRQQNASFVIFNYSTRKLSRKVVCLLRIFNYYYTIIKSSFYFQHKTDKNEEEEDLGTKDFRGKYIKECNLLFVVLQFKNS